MPNIATDHGLPIPRPMKRRAAIRTGLQRATALLAAGSSLSCDRGGVGGEYGVAGPASRSGREDRDFRGEIGITTGGFDSQRERGEMTLENLPRFLNGELGMSLIDVNSRWFTSFEHSYVDACRELAVASGCHYSLLKVNHQFGDLYADDAAQAAAAMDQARRMVDVAGWLGARWIRFTLPEKRTLFGELPKHRELLDYAAAKSVQMVVENGGWMRTRADSIELGVKALNSSGEAVDEGAADPSRALAAAAPDTGNWDDSVREEGLAKSFPGAVSCDFKVFDLNAEGEHEKYDIRRCFDIGWQAGYRGPWLLEHWNQDTSALVRDLLLLRDKLRTWMRDSPMKAAASRSALPR